MERMLNSNNTICLATAVALGCVGALYIYIKRKLIVKEAAVAFHYMRISVVSDEETCDKAISELRSKCEKLNAVGFDCEWVTVNGKRHPVALLQMSTEDGLCVLFRLSHMNTVPSSLKNFLEDESIYKVGVGAIDDAKYLLLDNSVHLRSTLDLRHLAVLCGHPPGGLAALTKSLLRVQLDKSWRVRCSDWEAPALSPRQRAYAAADAHAAARVLAALPARAAWPACADRPFKMCCCAADGGGKKSKPEALPNKKYKHSVRASPLYDNCRLLAPDGELLCTCNRKKAQWYVDKQLADVVGAEPLTVRLRFEPAGRGAGPGRYYATRKENRCCVCGDASGYIRRNVVPREYRRLFPEIMKDYSSHDVVLLCAACHRRSNAGDAAVRARLAEQAGALQEKKFVEDAEIKQARSAARALLHHSGSLPAARLAALQHVLRRRLPGRDLTPELLRETADLQYIIENTDHESVAEKVVEHFLKSGGGGLLRLEEVWREHFLATMRPQYLPPLWSLTHTEERLRVKYDEGRLTDEDLKLVGIFGWKRNNENN